MSSKLKTTVLLPAELHQKLTQLSKQRGVSIAELVRQACEETYGSLSVEAKLSLIDSAALLNLPVATRKEMKIESTADHKKLL